MTNPEHHPPTVRSLIILMLHCLDGAAAASFILPLLLLAPAANGLVPSLFGHTYHQHVSHPPSGRSPPCRRSKTNSALGSPAGNPKAEAATTEEYTKLRAAAEKESKL